MWEKHGMSSSKTYIAWKHMVMRCYNKNDKGFCNYGGRGIQVCDRWRNFENFYADMGIAPKGLSLDRIDNNGNYEPPNCRWITMAQQNRNSRHNKNIIYNGQKKCIAEWAKTFEVNYQLFRRRIIVRGASVTFKEMGV